MDDDEEPQFVRVVTPTTTVRIAAICGVHDIASHSLPDPATFAG